MHFYTSLGLNADASGTSSAVDYSYLLGRRGQGVRHNPHVQVQERATNSDLLEISKLLRSPADAHAPEAEKAE